MQFRIIDNLAEHDKVAIRWVLQATLKKKLSKHQKLQIMGMSIFQFEDDKIKEAWITFDALNPALQIGVVDFVPSKVQKVKKDMFPLCFMHLLMFFLVPFDLIYDRIGIYNLTYKKRSLLSIHIVSNRI